MHRIQIDIQFIPNKMPFCKYCENEYKNAGGLTLHLNKCPERKKEIQLQEAKFKQPIFITNNVVVNNHNLTVVVNRERSLFNSFANQLMFHLKEE